MKDNGLIKDASATTTDKPGTPVAVQAAPPPPDPAAAGATSPVDAPHAWRWRDTDGTIRKARMRTGLFRSNSASSASSVQRENNNSNSNTSSAATTAANNSSSNGGSNSNANSTNNSSGTTNNSNSNATNNGAGLVLKKKFPPDGGLGLRALALWSYWPQEGVRDELMFPKGAEIREAEDINGDWFWGVYCGKKGLFPGNYVRAT
ncbi:Regulator of cytoskeleton and endocytosis [Lasiodiplodia theobromae]|uniref:Regulator of cytoskeleton and endocytosis n=1 Tax=Lasiodiplodia theobromae TaxID=45133 RepID=A0A5N5DAF1_9PEZI|nr:Regulator of cytoskeleton and endocytosis [Lasiodiplodia theobromae]